MSVLTTIFLWVGRGQSNLPLLITELSGLQFGGVLYPIILHYRNCRICRCHYLLDRQATKLSVWERWAIYLSSWYGQKIGGTVWETDSGRDSSVWVVQMPLFEMFYFTDTLIETNTSAIWNVSNMINKWRTLTLNEEVNNSIQMSIFCNQWEH